ncbi:MAG: hypothetical protein AAGA80_08405 [Cyanobacteria bacterium P01_F01_bin.143]
MKNNCIAIALRIIKMVWINLSLAIALGLGELTFGDLRLNPILKITLQLLNCKMTIAR